MIIIVMRPLVGFAAAAGLLLGGCGGGSGGAVEANSAASSTPTQATADIPEGAVEGPRFAATSDGVWMYGGVTGTPEHWQANNTATLYGTDGSIKTTVSLPIPDGQFLFYASLLSSPDGDPIVIGDACVVPSSENAGCNSPPTTVAFALAPDGATAIQLPEALSQTIGTKPGAGLAYGVGRVGSSVVVVRQVADGPIPALTFTPAAYLLDPSSGELSSIDLPDGILTADSVCGDGSNLFAITPQLDDQRHLTSVTILKSSDTGETWAQLAQLDSLKTEVLVGGHLTCLAGSLILQADATPSELVAVDSESGTQRGDSIQVASPIPSVATSLDNSEILIAGTHVPEKDFEITEDIVLADYYTFTAQGGWTHVGTQRRPTGSKPPQGLLDGGAVVDVSSRSGNPSDESPFTVIDG